MLRVTHELFLSEYFYTEIRINARSTEIKHKLLIILIKKQSHGLCYRNDKLFQCISVRCAFSHHLFQSLLLKQNQHSYSLRLRSHNYQFAFTHDNKILSVRCFSAGSVTIYTLGRGLRVTSRIVGGDRVLEGGAMKMKSLLSTHNVDCRPYYKLSIL